MLHITLLNKIYMNNLKKKFIKLKSLIYFLLVFLHLNNFNSISNFLNDIKNISIANKTKTSFFFGGVFGVLFFKNNNNSFFYEFPINFILY
jgi:hypothetical protein